MDAVACGANGSLTLMDLGARNSACYQQTEQKSGYKVRTVQHPALALSDLFSGDDDSDGLA